jgi:hypothetical protein
VLKFYRRALRESLAWAWAGVGVVTTLLPFLPWAVSWLVPQLSTWWIVQAAQNHPVRMAIGGAAIGIISYILYAPYAKFQKAEKQLADLKERLKPRITVSYSEDDEQCRLSPGDSINPMFRVIAHLGGDIPVTNVVARVEAIRKDGHKLRLLEPIRLRFHSSGSSGELETMRPETSEPLDMLKLVSGELWPALAYNYEAFNHRCCNDPNHTYELDVSISSSIVPTKFTYVCHWTGDFNTTKPYIKQPLSVPNTAT